MAEELIQERDLGVVTPGTEDMVRVVQEGRSRLARVGALPPPAGLSAQISEVLLSQEQAEGRLVNVETAQASLLPRVAGAEGGLLTLGTRLDVVEQAQVSGSIGYATKALMDADLAPAAGSIALVTNDPTPANNGAYRKSGATGTGSWVLSADRTTALQADVASLAVRGVLLLNRNADYPLRAGTYNGVTSANRSAAFAAALLDFKVVGARPGKVYAVRYFVNGSTALSGNFPYGWVVDEHDAATYASSSARTIALARGDVVPTFPLSGKIETVRIPCQRIPGVTFVITIDTSQLPAWGTEINANTSIRDGYSWLIDPHNYSVAGDGQTSATRGDSLFTINAVDKSVLMAWRLNNDHLLRLKWGLNGFNNLFNFVSIERSAGTVPLEEAVWSVISGGSTTDWIPPLTIEAASGDGGAMIYTGGNHGSNGDASGSQTARMVTWDCWVDGEKIGSTSQYGGRATEVVVRWVNELMAYNTISLVRYVLKQTVVAKFRSGMVEISIEHEALEALTVRTDNGLQMRGDAYETSVHYLGGAANGRELAAGVTDSGTKSAAPNAWAITCRGSYGDQIAWLDTTTGAGTAAYVATGSPLLRKNVSTWKFYQAIVAGMTRAMVAGDAYSYRGGYAWAPPGMTVGDVDLAFAYRMGASDMIAWAFHGTGAHAGKVLVPPQYAGRVLEYTSELIGGSGFSVSAPGYAAPRSRITP